MPTLPSASTSAARRRLHGSDKGDSLFRNWVSSIDAVDSDPHWASVVMTSDKTVVPNYSAKSAGEYITHYGTLVGDNLAIASKKMIGVASAAVSAYVQTIFMNVTLVASGIGYVAQGLEYVGVHGRGHRRDEDRLQRHDQHDLAALGAHGLHHRVVGRR